MDTDIEDSRIRKSMNASLAYDDMEERNKTLLKVRIFDSRASKPVQRWKGNAGWDISAIEDSIIKPGERSVIRTGLGFSFPKNHFGFVANKSSIATKYNVDVCGGNY